MDVYSHISAQLDGCQVLWHISVLSDDLSLNMVFVCCMRVVTSQPEEEKD